MDGVLVESGNLAGVAEGRLARVGAVLTGEGYIQLARKAKHNKVTGRISIAFKRVQFTCSALRHSLGSCIPVEYNLQD
jgi:hypothetical protein